MHKIKNLTNSPQDLESIGGMVRLPAMGSVEGEFAAEYISALIGSGMYEVSQAAREAPKPVAKSQPKPRASDKEG